MLLKYSFYIIGTLLLFNSCKNNEHEKILFSTINESIEASIKNIEYSNEVIYKDFEDKLYKPVTAEITKVWQPKVLTMQTLSKNIYHYIDSLKEHIKKTKENDLDDKTSNTLYEQLKIFQFKTLSIDSEIYHQFSNSLNVVSKDFDLIKNNSLDFKNAYFKNNSMLASIAILTTFQNNIKNTEHNISKFCNSKIGYVDGPGYFSKFGVLVGQNTTHLKSGEILEISAGVGTYSSAAQAKISINDQIMKVIDTRARAEYKIKASQKIGKHMVPIKINFKDEDGVERNMLVEVQYFVDE